MFGTTRTSRAGFRTSQNSFAWTRNPFATNAMAKSPTPILTFRLVILPLKLLGDRATKEVYNGGRLRRPRFSPALPTSRNAPALRRLTGKQEGLDQLTFAADCHAGEFLVPRTLRHLGLPVKPPGQQS